MYTPNELREIKFNKAVFGGYDAGDVDKILSAISDDYAALFKENVKLKKNMKTLADAVEDYRSVDEAMRKALITAQNMANDMVAEAERKCNDMLANASSEAKLKIRELSNQIAEEEAKLASAKAATAEFVDKMAALCDSEREKFLSLKDAVAPAAVSNAEPLKPAFGDTIDQISKSLEEKVKIEDEEIVRKESEKSATVEAVSDDVKVVSDTIPFNNNIPTEDEMEMLEAAAEKNSRSRRVDFQSLKFGKNYDIKNEDKN